MSFHYECHFVFRIIDNVRGELQKRQWIIFDGDVDPEWVENLNSVLDNSKLLTLPNGERLAIPPNVCMHMTLDCCSKIQPFILICCKYVNYKCQKFPPFPIRNLLEQETIFNIFFAKKFNVKRLILDLYF